MSNIVKMCKKIFPEYLGNNWSEDAIRNVTSQALSAVPVWRKANLRDVPPSKRCVAAQRFCSAAISSKSTGSAAAVAATVPVGCGGQGKKQQQHFSNLGDTEAVH